MTLERFDTFWLFRKLSIKYESVSVTITVDAILQTVSCYFTISIPHPSVFPPQVSRDKEQFDGRDLSLV